MKRYLIIPVVLSLLMFTSCEKTIKLNADTKDPKLVINSLFNVDSNWSVNLSRSLSVLDNGDLTDVSGGVVKIFNANSGSLIEQLTNNGDNTFVSTVGNKPQVGITYKVEASASGYTDVSATNLCPTSISITSCDTASVSDPDYGEQMEITLTFNDPIGDNYYSVNIFSQEYYVDFNNDTIWYTPQNKYLNSNNPVFDVVSGDAFGNELTFNDKTFDGTQKTIKFRYYDGGDGGTFKVYLNSISYDTYQYIRTYQINSFADGDPFAQPVQVYSNVENGFGIFGGKNYDVRSF